MLDDVYAVKQVAFLGKTVTTVCQNINGPCPLLAICNVLLLRGHVTIHEHVSPDGLISAHDLMRVVQHRLVSTNPLVRVFLPLSCVVMSFVGCARLACPNDGMLCVCRCQEARILRI